MQTEKVRRSRLLLPVAMALVAAAVLVLTFSFAGDDINGGGAVAGDFDQLVFVNEDGTTGTLADHRGEALVVNFFASWCAPCRAELPDIEAVHAASGGRITVLGINQDLDETTWRSFVAETEITFPTVFQPQQEIWEALDLFGMPSTVLITPDGELVYSHSGILNEETLLELISQHLAVEL